MLLSGGVRISLQDVDAGLLEEVPVGQRPALRDTVELPGLDLAPGAWDPDHPDRSTFGGIVVAGLLAHAIGLPGTRDSLTLFGPGDIVQPWAEHGTSIEVAVRWRAEGDVRLALLDKAWLVAAHRAPALALAIQRRLAAQVHRVAVQHAVTQLPRVEQRIMGTLWGLADTWGHVTPAGVRIPLRLTHQMLGEVVGARRPTVTLALAALTDERFLAHDAGGWTLLPSGPVDLADIELQH